MLWHEILQKISNTFWRSGREDHPPSLPLEWSDACPRLAFTKVCFFYLSAVFYAKPVALPREVVTILDIFSFDCWEAYQSWQIQSCIRNFLLYFMLTLWRLMYDFRPKCLPFVVSKVLTRLGFCSFFRLSLYILQDIIFENIWGDFCAFSPQIFRLVAGGLCQHMPITCFMSV